MANVILRAPLSELAGGRRHVAAGATVDAVLAALERSRPSLAGWILDEQGRVRRHINVYVNGELAAEGGTVEDGDDMYVVPAITGGAE